MTYNSAYIEGVRLLESVGIEESKLEARYLLEEVCNMSYGQYLMKMNEELEETLFSQFKDLVKKRMEGIPIQYILGKQDFMGLTFRVNENVLIPRQDTEILVTEAEKVLESGDRILDLCTGSGCIIISLLYYNKEVEGIGSDLSAKALQVAEENRKAILGENSCLKFLQGDLFESLEEKEDIKFDIIVSNPPYIPSKVVESLEEKVKDYEPRMALDGKEDGLYFYREITRKSKAFLKSKGWLFFEIGHDQAEDVMEMLMDNQFEKVQCVKDLSGFDRVVFGKLKSNLE